MTHTAHTMPGDVFESLVQALLDFHGEDWVSDKAANKKFAAGTVSVLAETEGVHLIGDPEKGDDGQHFNLWVDLPVEDLLVADDIAFAIFAELSEDVFICARAVEEKGVRYRFITGSEKDGHLGSLHLTGPHAMEFVNLHRLRRERGTQYSA